MQESASTGHQGPRSALWTFAPLGLVFLFLSLGLAVWEPFPPGIWHDDGVYVLLGRSLAEGHGLTYLGVPGAPPAPKFPPLFPLLLGLVWFVSPEFPENLSLIGGVNVVLTALAGGAFYLYLTRGLKASAGLALGATALIWISAHLWRVAWIPLSEPLFLLTLFLGLWAGSRMESREGPFPVLLFLLAGGSALYARTLGIGLLAAGVLTLLLSGRGRAGLWTGVGMVGLFAPWLWWSRRAAEGIPSPLMDVLGPYTGWLSAQILQGPWEFTVYVAGNLAHLVARTVGLLLPGVPGPQWMYGVLMAPFLLLGLWELYRRSRILVLTLLFSLGILVVWPFQEIRLLVPFQPILALSVIMGFWKLLHSWTLPSWTRRLALGLALAWTLTYGSVSVLRLADGWTTQSYRVRSEALLDAARAISEKTPPSAVVGAPELWAGIHLLTGRAAVPSARFRPLSGGDPVQGTPEQQYEIWIGSGVTHILVEHGGQVHGPAIDRIDSLCEPGTVEVLDTKPGRFLVALNWGEECQRRVLEGGEGTGGGN